MESFFVLFVTRVEGVRAMRCSLVISKRWSARNSLGMCAASRQKQLNYLSRYSSVYHKTRTRRLCMICVMRAVYQKGEGNFCCTSIDGLHVLLYARTTKAHSKLHQYCFVLLSFSPAPVAMPPCRHPTDKLLWLKNKIIPLSKHDENGIDRTTFWIFDTLCLHSSLIIIGNIINDRRILFVRVGFGAFVDLDNIVIGRPMLDANSVGFFFVVELSCFFFSCQIGLNFPPWQNRGGRNL